MILRMKGGHKHRAWWPFLPKEGGLEGSHRTVNARRVLPDGRQDPVGRFGISHPSMNGTRDMPRRKRRTISHNKGEVFAGQSTLSPKQAARKNRSA